jgi:hypothetical protein
MVFYVDKLCAMYPAFTISSLTVHRFLITAATVAAKGLSDSSSIPTHCVGLRKTVISKGNDVDKKSDSRILYHEG